jgi:hypothetical protein
MIIGHPLVSERIAASVNSRSPSDSFVVKDLHPHVGHTYPSFNHLCELFGRSDLFCHRFTPPHWPERCIACSDLGQAVTFFRFGNLMLPSITARWIAATTPARLLGAAAALDPRSARSPLKSRQYD